MRAAAHVSLQFVPAARPRTRPITRPGLPASILLLAALSGCAGAGRGVSGDPRYAGLSCAPFARALTGVSLRGEAAAWWGQADGRYARAHTPQPGAILVLRASDRLPSGHVSVVSRVLDGREIEVIQANWVPGELERDQPVIDVSSANDWTLVRVWYPPTGAMGSHAYPAYGFILPPAPLDHDALARAAAGAAERASGGG